MESVYQDIFDLAKAVSKGCILREDNFCFAKNLFTPTCCEDGCCIPTLVIIPEHKYKPNAFYPYLPDPNLCQDDIWLYLDGWQQFDNIRQHPPTREYHSDGNDRWIFDINQMC
jgi:hypothetical protein